MLYKCHVHATETDSGHWCPASVEQVVKLGYRKRLAAVRDRIAERDGYDVDERGWLVARKAAAK